MTAHDLGRRTGRADWTAACVYLSVFFQPISARYERGSVILASDKSYGDWGSIFGETRLWDIRQTSG
jgi:hypothetical protein